MFFSFLAVLLTSNRFADPKNVLLRTNGSYDKQKAAKEKQLISDLGVNFGNGFSKNLTNRKQYLILLYCHKNQLLQIIIENTISAQTDVLVNEKILSIAGCIAICTVTCSLCPFVYQI